MTALYAAASPRASRKRRSAEFGPRASKKGPFPGSARRIVGRPAPSPGGKDAEDDRAEGPAQVRQAAFAAPRPAGKPVYRALALDNGGAALLAITAIKAGTAGANPQNDEQLISQYMRRDREGDMRAYLLELQRRATVKTNPNIFQ